MPLGVKVGASYPSSGPPLALAVAEVPEKGTDEHGASELRTYEVVGGFVRVRFDYCSPLVVLMRSLGVANCWKQGEKAYVVPLARFAGEVEATLKRLEFEAL